MITKIIGSKSTRENKEAKIGTILNFDVYLKLLTGEKKKMKMLFNKELIYKGLTFHNIKDKSVIM